MASVIDPERHADLLELQLAVFQRDAELYADQSDDAEPLREKVRKAVSKKEAALRESGLVDEHGYHVASQDLKKAAREAQQAQAPGQ